MAVVELRIDGTVRIGHHQHFDAITFRLDPYRGERVLERRPTDSRDDHAQPRRHVSTSSRTEPPSAGVPATSTRPYAPPPVARAEATVPPSRGSASMASLIEFVPAADR